MTNDLDKKISKALSDENDELLKELLSTAHYKKKGTIYSIAYALVELMPPFENVDIAETIFAGQFDFENEKNAAIFSGYIYIYLQPTTPNFVEVLDKYSLCPLSNYILALYFDYQGDTEKACMYIDKSLSLSHFTKNVLFKLQMYSANLSKKEQQKLREEIPKLIVNKHHELSPPPSNVPSLINDYLNELILGSHITSTCWDLIRTRNNIK